MPDENVTETVAAETVDPVEIDWKAKAREWERRAKDNFAQINELKPKADKFQELEEASKGEAQRLAEAAETARRDLESARAETIRYKAAATHGISADHFDLLGSGTEAEIEARAVKIRDMVAAHTAATQAATATTAPPVTRPVEQLRAGATPAGEVSEDDAILAKLGLL